jgi:hypothetical protein
MTINSTTSPSARALSTASRRYRSELTFVTTKPVGTAAPPLASSPRPQPHRSTRPLTAATAGPVLLPLYRIGSPPPRNCQTRPLSFVARWTMRTAR